MIWSLKTGLSKWAGGSDGKESTCNAGDSGLIPGSEDPLETGMATHSSILAWRIPWMEDPGGLQSMGLQRVGHNWVTEPFHFDFPNFCTFSSLSFLLKNWTHSFLSPPFSWKPLSNIAKNHRLITFWPFRNTGSLDTWVVMGTNLTKHVATSSMGLNLSNLQRFYHRPPSMPQSTFLFWQQHPSSASFLC